MTWQGSVADLVELRTIPEARRDLGFPLLVRSNAYWYMFDSTSNKLDDDINVIVPDVGTGNWLRVAASIARETLDTNRAYYVDPIGDDINNDGLSPTSPFATISKALDIATQLDLGPFNVTINLAPGTYGDPIVLKTLVRTTGEVIITGNLSSPGQVVFDVVGSDVISGNSVNGYQIEGITLKTSPVSLGPLVQPGYLINLFNSTIQIKGIYFEDCEEDYSVRMFRSVIEILDNATANPAAGDLRITDMGNLGMFDVNLVSLLDMQFRQIFFATPVGSATTNFLNITNQSCTHAGDMTFSSQINLSGRFYNVKSLGLIDVTNTTVPGSLPSIPAVNASEAVAHASRYGQAIDDTP